MRCASLFTLLTIMAFAPGAASAGAGLSLERAGLGLKAVERVANEDGFGNAAARAWQAGRTADYALYGGARALPRAELRRAESYAGIVYTGSGAWASSFEAAYVPETLVAPRRYALSGQVHTALSGGRMLSIGLKYRFYDTDAGSRFGASGDLPAGNGYTLAPYRLPGSSVAPGYQLQFSYQHSAASSFGLALGRDAETFTPYSDTPGGPRQFTFTGQHWLTPSWALSYDLLSQDATSPMRVQGLRLGVRYRF